MTEIQINQFCNWVKFSENEAPKFGVVLRGLGLWTHPERWGKTGGYWEFRFYNTSLN